MLPDTDLYLQRISDAFKHHGILHTVLAVSLIALVLGPLVGWLLKRTIGSSDWFSPAAEAHAAVFGFVMVWIAGLSHTFADMLSALDIAEAIEPFWALYQQSIGMDFVWYSNAWFDWGLLLVGLGLNAVFYYRNGDSAARHFPEPP